MFILSYIYICEYIKRMCEGMTIIYNYITLFNGYNSLSCDIICLHRGPSQCSY